MSATIDTRSRWRSKDDRDNGRTVEVVEHYPVGDRFRVRNLRSRRLSTVKRSTLLRSFEEVPHVPLVVHGWHTECGRCGYGSGGWPAAFNGQDTPILTPESTVCHGCGRTFTHTVQAA